MKVTVKSSMKNENLKVLHNLDSGVKDMEVKNSSNQLNVFCFVFNVQMYISSKLMTQMVRL